MTRVGQSARITLKGFDREGINHESPLEDQVVLVYRAARRYAEANKFKRGTHRGHTGLTGPMVMKRITSALFPDTDENHVDRLNGLINQVLRKTDACVCVAQPSKREDSPIWFVNDHMPQNLVIVALSHSKKQPDLAPKDKWRDKQEARLTPEEAGETKTPGPVDVHFQEPSHIAESPIANPKDEHAQLLTDVMEFVTRSPLPLTALEVHNLFRPDLHMTSIRKALDELLADGHLHRRKETPDEMKLRANGEFPRGRRSWLYSASEHIIERPHLPDGAPTLRPSLEWAQNHKDNLDKAMDTVLEVISRSYPKGTTSRPRSIGRIAEAGGMSQLLTKQAIDQLLSLGFIYKASNSTYYLSDRMRGPSTETETKPEPEPEPTEEETPMPTPPPAPPIPVEGDRDEMVKEFMRLAQQLTLTPTDPEAETLRAENERLVNDNAKLRQAVKSLKATIEALTDL